MEHELEKREAAVDMGRLIGWGSGGPHKPPLIAPTSGEYTTEQRQKTIFAGGRQRELWPVASLKQFRPQEFDLTGEQTVAAVQRQRAAARQQLATNNMVAGGQGRLDGASLSSWWRSCRLPSAQGACQRGHKRRPEARMGLCQTMSWILLILFGAQVFLLEGFCIHQMACASSLTLGVTTTATNSTPTPTPTPTPTMTTTVKSLPTTTTSAENNSASLINNNNTSERQQLVVVCNGLCNCLQVKTYGQHEVAPPLAASVANSEAELAAFVDQWSAARADAELEETSGDPDEANSSSTEPTVSAHPPASSNKPAAIQPVGMTLFPEPEQGGSGVNLHNLRRHQHLRHNHQPLGPGRDAGSSGPQLYAQSLYSSQAPKLSYHAHTPYVRASAPMSSPAGAMMNNQPNTSANQTAPLAKQRAKRLLPLAELDMANGKLNWNSKRNLNKRKNNTREREENEVVDWTKETSFVQAVEEMLLKLEQDQSQSLSLGNNQLQFEVWSELYALLASHLRRRLHRLDLSRNELVKLGITFTGYIEHHLAQTHGAWPHLTSQAEVANSNNNNNKPNSPLNVANKMPSIITRPGSPNQKHYPNQLMGAGKLYTMVHERLQKAAMLTNNQTTATMQQQHNQTSMLLLQPMLIKALDLSHNKLKWLINDQFRALKQVQAIRLDHNRIRYIHQHAFSGLESLRYLNLNFNRLQVIYIEQFQTNYNLQSLTLRSNYLAYLRGGSFASLANLKRLDLSHNRMTIVSNNAFVGLESLEWLNCSSNQFVHVPSASLHPLTNLRHLDLSDNLIAQLAPGTFFHLPIEELWLEQNEQLVSVDRGAFWDLPYLRRLHLRWNPMLMSINSQAFVGTQNLQQIDVEGCQSLELTARQLLDNITNAATSRQLLAISRLAASGANHSDNHHHSSTSTSNLTSAVASFHSLLPPLNGSSRLTQTNRQQLQQPQQVTTQTAKYFYFLVALALVVAALKLVFKFTSTSHYLTSRRRRRRVYEANSSEHHDQTGKDFGAEFELAICSSSQPLSSLSASSSSRTNSPLASSASCRSGSDGDCQSSSYDPSVIEESSTHDKDDHRSDNRDREDHDGGGHHKVDDYDAQRQQQELALGAPSAASHDELARERERELEREEEISVISGQCGPSPTSEIEGSFCCQLGCGGAQRIVVMEHQHHHQQQDASGGGAESGESSSSNGDIQTHQPHQAPGHSAMDLIHSQLVAAGFDYGHANCAHFYQSLGPALQLADITANFVNLNMDFY